MPLQSTSTFGAFFFSAGAAAFSSFFTSSLLGSGLGCSLKSSRNCSSRSFGVTGTTSIRTTCDGSVRCPVTARTYLPSRLQAMESVFVFARNEAGLLSPPATGTSWM
jgi:hypothetical protein